MEGEKQMMTPAFGGPCGGFLNGLVLKSMN